MNPPGHDGCHELHAVLARTAHYIDVRSPAEFANGTLPGAVNLPILNDAERHQVGLEYKQQGNSAATALGHRLVSGALRQARIDSWQAFAQAHEPVRLYCWRGGQRSELAERWLHEAGCDVARVPGGFKALRSACLTALDAAPERFDWLVLGGRTGSGKTDLIQQLPRAIDLEGLARHRGSAFGAHDTPQPTPVTFENELAVTSLRHDAQLMVVEDEGRTIGRLALPTAWHERMQRAPVVILEIDLAARVANIQREYITEPLNRGQSPERLLQRYGSALDRIRKRLGGTRHAAVRATLERSFGNGDHGPWIEQLLTWYYDPMYDYQLQKKLSRVVARGDMAEAAAFISGYAP